MEKISRLEQQLAAANTDKSSPSSERCFPDAYTDELKKKIQSQVIGD